MKKLAILAVLFTMMTVNAQAQWFDFDNNANDFTIGLNVGTVGYRFTGNIDDTYNGMGVGISLSFAGIYLDFIYQSPEHRWSNKIAPLVYEDHTALTINAGYKIPVLKWLYVTPVIGYSNETTGLTDCTTININQENHSIYHDYDREHIYHHFNYGLGISFKPTRWFEFGSICSAHAVYGNISLNLIGLSNKK